MRSKNWIWALTLATTFNGPVLAEEVDLNVKEFFNPDGTATHQDGVGTATLTRSDDGIRLDLDTAELQSDGAYTVWWVIFNVPEACIDGCNGTDLGVAAVNPSLMNAGGGVADDDGNFSLDAFLPVGFMHTNPPFNGPVTNPDYRKSVGKNGRGQRQVIGPGLQNTNAEVHIVVRCHGPSDGTVGQISYFDGGCDAVDPVTGDPAGGTNGFGCFDAQFAIFLPEVEEP